MILIQPPWSIPPKAYESGQGIEVSTNDAGDGYVVTNTGCREVKLGQQGSDLVRSCALWLDDSCFKTVWWASSGDGVHTSAPYVVSLKTHSETWINGVESDGTSVTLLTSSITLPGE